MKMKSLIVLLVLVSVVSCSKKAPQAPATQEQGTTGAVEVSTDGTPFVIPPSAKKQAKYFPEGSPTRAIQDLDDMLDSYILLPKTSEEEQYNAKLKKAVVQGTFDIRELCRLSLDTHWGERTSAEQNYFVDLMTRLLEKKAIFSKEQGQKKKAPKTSAYKVTYEGHKFLNPEQTVAQSMSSVNIPSEHLKIELHYKLRNEKGRWNIFDVIVDGASLLDNYKYQFDKIIDKDGYPDLVHRMESKLKELDQKATPESVGG